MHTTPHQNNCIFCKIVAKEIPAEIVYEDAHFLAFLDIRPLSPGHTLIIPKEHYRWVWDVPTYTAYTELARTIALALRGAFNTMSVWSKVVGEEIEHAHIWVFPHPKEAIGDKNNFKENAERLRQALASLSSK